jgi:cell division transport system permease protein
MLRETLMATVFFRRSAKRGIVNVFREPGFGTAIGSLFGVVLLAQIIVLLAVGVQGGLVLLRERTDLRLQIRDTATDAQIQDLYQNIRQLPYVDDVVYVTREQAYERQKKRDPTLIDFLVKFGIDNPFPDTMGVRLRSLDDYPAFLQFLKQPVFAAAVDPSFLTTTTDQERQIVELTTVVRSAQIVLLFIIGLAVVVLLFVVVELIRRRALTKRQELFIEQLVGASRMEILMPFMVEMACMLLLALIASVILSAAIVLLLPFALPVLGSGGIFGEWSGAAGSVLLVWSPWVIFTELVFVALLSGVGTLIALREQMSSSLLPSPHSA